MLAAGSIAGFVDGSAARPVVADAVAFGVRATLVVTAAFDTGFNVSRGTRAASCCGSGASSTRAFGRSARGDELGTPISTTMPTTQTTANAIHHGLLRRKDPVACSTATASAAFLDGLVRRAAVFFARTVRVGLSVFFVRTDTLLSEILCRALSA
jgi:hypothetical protein